MNSLKQIIRNHPTLCGAGVVLTVLCAAIYSIYLVGALAMRAEKWIVIKEFLIKDAVSQRFAEIEAQFFLGFFIVLDSVTKIFIPVMAVGLLSAFFLFSAKGIGRSLARLAKY